MFALFVIAAINTNQPAVEDEIRRAIGLGEFKEVSIVAMAIMNIASPVRFVRRVISPAPNLFSF